MAVNPSKLAIDALFERLEDSTDGFNAIYNALAPSYGLPATVNIDFNSGFLFSFLVDVDL